VQVSRKRAGPLPDTQNALTHGRTTAAAKQAAREATAARRAARLKVKQADEKAERIARTQKRLNANSADRFLAGKCSAPQLQNLELSRILLGFEIAHIILYERYAQK
jgi:hypothetical protein